jgi:acyl-CoA thioesterase I
VPTPVPIVKIMAVGDSITQADADHDSYRRPLWQSLQGAGYRVDFVGSQTEHRRGPAPHSDFDRDHEGHWGFRTDEVLDVLPPSASAAGADIVLLHLGHNDVFERQSNGSTLGELSAIIDVVRGANPRVTVLLAQIIPTENDSVNQDIEDLNAAIPGLAASRSTAASPVIVVDHYSGFDGRRDTYDGVHPSADGEQRMASVWLNALRPFLRAPSVSSADRD